MKFVKYCMLLVVLAFSVSLPASLPAFADAGHGPGPGPGWGHGPGWGPRPVSCYAQDWRGDTYRGDSYDYRQAEYDALNACQYYSYNPRSCRLVGCE